MGCVPGGNLANLGRVFEVDFLDAKSAIACGHFDRQAGRVDPFFRANILGDARVGQVVEADGRIADVEDAAVVGACFRGQQGCASVLGTLDVFGVGEVIDEAPIFAAYGAFKAVSGIDAHPFIKFFIPKADCHPWTRLGAVGVVLKVPDPHVLDKARGPRAELFVVGEVTRHVVVPVRLRPRRDRGLPAGSHGQPRKVVGQRARRGGPGHAVVGAEGERIAPRPPVADASSVSFVHACRRVEFIPCPRLDDYGIDEDGKGCICAERHAERQ